MPASVRGLDEAKDATDAIGKRLRNLAPILRVEAQDLATLIDNAFDRSRSPMGVDWPALAFSTIMARGSKRARRSRRALLRRAHAQDRRENSTGRITSIAIDALHANTKPLIDTGRLRRSITTRVKPMAIEYGTNVVYAATQQFGTTRIPARPFLPVTPSGDFGTSGDAAAFIAEFEDAIANYIETGVLPR